MVEANEGDAMKVILPTLMIIMLGVLGVEVGLTYSGNWGAGSASWEEPLWAPWS